METKHTPGPWKISKYINYIGFSVWAADRGCIAERWYDKTQDKPYGDELNANAQLISAAPDLLRACKIALETIENTDMNGVVLWVSPPYQLDCVHESVSDLLSEAIAKAEGK
jgi:hypothetical protein